MSRYINPVLVFLYVAATIFCFLLVLAISGIRFSDRLAWLVMTGWVLFCFGSGYFLPGLRRFFHGPLRKPVRAEEVRLKVAFEEVRERAKYARPVKLRVEDSKKWNAFASGFQTIAISRGLLASLSDEELKGVLAHELGHLESYDPVVGSAFVMAGYLPGLVRVVYRLVVGIVMSGFRESHRVRTGSGTIRVARYNLFGGLFWLVICGVLLKYFGLVMAVVAIVLFVIVFAVLNWVFRLLKLLLSRLAEYRQDAFAYKLGYGAALHSVLYRMAEQEEDVNTSGYFIIFHSTHPVTFNRIRRLERLTIDGY